MSSMPFKDRTAEFASIVDIYHSKENNINNNNKKLTKADVVKNVISVNKRASGIGRKISSTAMKLKELTELAKSKTPFCDPAEKIERWTMEIKSEINAIKGDIEELNRFISRNKGNKQASDHSITVIHSLNSNLLNTTKELSDALWIRTQILKEQEGKRNLIVGRPGPAPIFRPPDIFMYDEDVVNNQEEVVIAVPILQTVENDLISQRVHAVRDIEAQMTEIQNIFKMLSNLIAQQQEQLLRIEENMETTEIYADSALAELLKYLKGMSSDRWLIIKAFVIILFFIFLWFMVFA